MCRLLSYFLHHSMLDYLYYIALSHIYNMPVYHVTLSYITLIIVLVYVDSIQYC